MKKIVHVVGTGTIGEPLLSCSKPSGASGTPQFNNSPTIPPADV